jgi:hypothetical protein
MSSIDTSIEQWRRDAITEMQRDESAFRRRWNAMKIDHEVLNFLFFPPANKSGQWTPRPVSRFCGFAHSVYRASDGFNRLYRKADMYNQIRLQLRFGEDVGEIVGWQEVEGCSEEVFRRLFALVLLGYSSTAVLQFAKNRLEDRWWEEPEGED